MMTNGGLSMELFDKKFVYLEWDDVLQGKKVVIGDTLGELKNKLHSELFDSVMENKGDYPFTPSENDLNFAMAYYDPNYECKRAYVQGKVIQYRNKGDDKWMVTSSPSWIDRCEFRVKPEKKWRPLKSIAELKQVWDIKRNPLVYHELEEPTIWVREKQGSSTKMIHGFDYSMNLVCIGQGHWCSLEYLFNIFEFLDGTPCGVEEVEELPEGK
jgi:hypothetical protein